MSAYKIVLTDDPHSRYGYLLREDIPYFGELIQEITKRVINAMQSPGATYGLAEISEEFKREGGLNYDVQ